MLVTYPGHSHPIYLEWKKWFYICRENYTPQAAEAKLSIETIAEHLYPQGCVVGRMIMMKDMEELEAEEKRKPPEARDE